MAQLGSMLPSFEGVPRWRNGSAPVQRDIAGKPVLVHFFSSGCPLCGEGLPVVLRLGAALAPVGLVIIGAYQPRNDVHAQAADADRECDVQIGTAHRCAADVDGILKLRFGHTWPPAYYVYDRAHRLRHFQEGNWELETMAAAVERCVKI
ncbi:MAG TPA: TlpA disulfide reductase family protein [Candidatus Eremiobacteraceae bacterium]|nr:TlpA disulfide reductase family protein [Candidatus Eremiobacteraceae bacterium]